MGGNHDGHDHHMTNLQPVQLRLVSCSLKRANEFVKALHRHNKPVVGHKFSLGVEASAVSLSLPNWMVTEDQWVLVGVAIVGGPVARLLDDGKTLEITRVCTDGTRNACSFLYGAVRKAALSLGHKRVVTYTLPEEGGASLRAAGYRIEQECAGGPAAAWHNRQGRNAEPVGNDNRGGKWRWVA